MAPRINQNQYKLPVRTNAVVRAINNYMILALLILFISTFLLDNL